MEFRQNAPLSVLLFALLMSHMNISGYMKKKNMGIHIIPEDVLQ